MHVHLDAFRTIEFWLIATAYYANVHLCCLQEAQDKAAELGLPAQANTPATDLEAELQVGASAHRDGFLYDMHLSGDPIPNVADAAWAPVASTHMLCMHAEAEGEG